MVEKKNPVEFIPAAEAAARLKTTELNVLMHVKRGKLVGRELDGRWEISLASLDGLQEGGPVAKGEVLCRPACAKEGGCGSCK